MENSEDLVAVLVTTELRGVFFGYANQEDLDQNRVNPLKLTNVRNLVYWSSDCHGFLGLTNQGPNKNCKVGPKCPEILLYKITSIAKCTEKSAKAWEAEPWKI